MTVSTRPTTEVRVADTCEEEDKAPGWFHWVTRISVVLGVIALIITIVVVGPQTITNHLRTIGLWFVVLIAMEAAGTCCDATAVYLMTRGVGAPTWRRIIVAQFAGRAVNTVTPAANLGEALKVSLLSRHCSTQRVLAAIMYTALTAFTISLVLVAIGTGLTAALFDVPRPAAITLGIAAGLCAMIAAGIYILVRRGMLSTLANLGARLHIVSKKRRANWRKRLDDLDARLSGKVGAQHRAGAAALILTSQLLQKAITFVAILAAGFHLTPGQLIAVMSAGVVIGWISTIVPMGIGISEGGNVALFSLIGAPLSLGVALALARRVNQCVFAGFGFAILAGDKVASKVHGHLTGKQTRRRTTSRTLPVQA
ncbi:MAG: hypothetical protein JWO36_87 [Myxococcales bacterium]|nr:hypothetical protein [Myxococcales bacterium]